MVRKSKQERKRLISPKKRHYQLDQKTGPLKDNLPMGFKEHKNAFNEGSNHFVFIPKIH
jgi:hypothetical protein